MATLLQDSFTEGSDGNLSAHTMNVGSGWNSFSGTWTIVAASDTAQPPTGVANAGAHADAGATDVVVSVDLIMPTTGSYALGLVLRTVDVDNTWQFVMEADGGGGAGDVHRIDLNERNGGTTTNRRSNNITTQVAIGTTATLSVTLSGNNIDASVTGAGGTLSITQWTNAHANGSVNSATKFGLYAFTAASYVQTLFDNFLVTGSAGGGGSGKPSNYYARMQRQFRKERVDREQRIDRAYRETILRKVA